MPQAVAVPAIMGGVGMAGDYMKNKAAEKAAKSQAKSYNQWLSGRPGEVQNLFNTLGQHGYDPYGPQTSTTSSSSTYDQTTNTFVSGEYKGIEGSLKSLIEGRLGAPSALPPGYAESQIRNINKAYGGTDAALRNQAAALGFGGAQTYGAGTANATARAGEIADLLGNLPLMERQMQNEDMAAARGLIEAFGKGSRTTGRSSSSGSSTSGPDLGLLASLLLSPGPQQSMETGMSPLGSALGGAAQIGSSLYNNYLLNKKKG